MHFSSFHFNGAQFRFEWWYHDSQLNVNKTICSFCFNICSLAPLQLFWYRTCSALRLGFVYDYFGVFETVIASVIFINLNMNDNKSASNDKFEMLLRDFWLRFREKIFFMQIVKYIHIYSIRSDILIKRKLSHLFIFISTELGRRTSHLI